MVSRQDKLHPSRSSLYENNCRHALHDECRCWTTSPGLILQERSFRMLVSVIEGNNLVFRSLGLVSCLLGSMLW